MMIPDQSQSGYKVKPMYPDKGRSDYRNKATPQQMVERFTRICEKVGFGKLTVEVANGVPKEVSVDHQNFRLDLTTDTIDSIIKPTNGPAHDGEPTASSS